MIRESILPLSFQSSCHSREIVEGVEMGFVCAPFQRVYVQSFLISGFYKISVLPALPIKGVEFIVDHDFAGGKVKPVPESSSLNSEADNTAFQDAFPACVMSCTLSKKYGPHFSGFLVTEQFPDAVPSNQQSHGHLSPVTSKRS